MDEERKILTRIKDCIKILDAVFKGEKDTLETIKTMRKAEKLWMDALAVAGQKRSTATGKDDAQKSNRSYYDEYATLAMQWAYSDKTKVGEQTIRSKKGKLIVIEKTHDGYIEVRTINNSERIDSIIGAVYEHNEGLKNASIRTDIERYENSEGNNLWDSELVGNTGKLGQNGGIYKNQHGSNRNGSLEESTRDSRIKHSLRGDVDSQGHHLSKEQIEYFKDSKVVDENGNLLVVHHGTGESFTQFRRNMIYFSDNADVADSYARDGKEKMTGYLNITKPFVVVYLSYIRVALGVSVQ